MSILCSTADVISSGSCPILFKVLMLNVAICSICLDFSSFDRLSSVADFSNTEARAPTSAGRAPFLPARRAMRFQFLPGRGHIDTAIWLHYVDANKTVGEEARGQLHKNAVCNIEQVLVATPHKTPIVRPPAPYHENF